MADREKERERGRGKSLGAQLDEAQLEATNLLADLQNAIHEIQEGAAPQGLIQLSQANLQIAIQGANQATQELTLATQQAAQATQEATQATQEATQATTALQSVQERVRNVINQLAVSGQSILAILGPAAAGRYQLHHDLMISIDLLFFVSQVSLLKLSMSSLVTTLKLLLLLLLDLSMSSLVATLMLLLLLLLDLSMSSLVATLMMLLLLLDLSMSSLVATLKLPLLLLKKTSC